MFYKYTEEELRSYCRTSIENLEKWARLVIDEALKKKYGENYFEINMENGDPIIKKSINDKATKMMEKNPDRFRGKIDTLFLEEIIYVLCKVQLYNNVFKVVLDEIYPDGCAEARTYLSRLIPIRNKLSHSNPISIREAERAVCYCNDFLDGVKIYFEKEGKDRMFNVPHAIKLNDSLGNEFLLKNEKSPEVICIKDKNGQCRKFNVGDKYSLWVTMDSSVDRECYTISWSINNKVLSQEQRLNLQVTEELVGESVYVTCRIVQNKSWHKYNGTEEDHRLLITFCVLPPVE